MGRRILAWPVEMVPLKDDIVKTAGRVVEMTELCLKEMNDGNPHLSDLMIDPIGQRATRIKELGREIVRQAPRKRGQPAKWVQNSGDVQALAMNIIDFMEEAEKMLPSNRYIVVKKCLELSKRQAEKIVRLMKRIPEPETEPELDRQVWREIEGYL